MIAHDGILSYQVPAGTATSWCYPHKVNLTLSIGYSCLPVLMRGNNDDFVTCGRSVEAQDLGEDNQTLELGWALEVYARCYSAPRDERILRH